MARMQVIVAAAALLLVQLCAYVGAQEFKTVAGKASFYVAPYVPSACYGNDQNQFPASRYFAAGGDGNPNIWGNGGRCGKWFKVRCVNNGCRRSTSINIKIVERCPFGCSGGRAFDLSYEAFSALANPDIGVMDIYFSGPYDSVREAEETDEELIQEVVSYSST